MPKYNFTHINNKELIRVMENACFMVAHKQTKSSTNYLDAIENEVLRRLEAYDREQNKILTEPWNGEVE